MNLVRQSGKIELIPIKLDCFTFPDYLRLAIEISKGIPLTTPATSMNAIEKTSIAKGVAIYIVDRILIDKPMSASELESVARSVTEDMGITDSDERNSIAALAVDYVSNDYKVVTELKDGVYWITYKGR